MNDTKYQHYKGGIYTVKTACIHTETGELMVCYCNTDDVYFVRPLEMFLEEVTLKSGATVPRFKLIEVAEEIA